MKLRLALVWMLIFSALPVFAIKDEYRTGILVHARPSQLDGKSCVMLTVVVGELVLVAQQCASVPWHAYVPAEFTEQGDVQVRVEDDKLLLRRPNGKDLRARIVRKALLRERVDLQEFWRRNAQDRDDDTPRIPDNVSPMNPASIR